MSYSVRRIELREIRLPLREPFRISSGIERERRILLVELLEGRGVTVWAECVAGTAPNYSPETIDTAWLMLREWLAPRLLEAVWNTAGDVHGLLAESFRGHRMARAVLEMGCWGLEAAIRGVSLSRLLGGERDRVPTGISLGIQESPGALAEKASAARAEGYRKIKLKIRPGADVDYVRAVRQALDAAAVLAVDGNSAYTLEALPTFEALDELGLSMIEQPLGRCDLVRHARLQERLSSPICLDESITGLERAEDMLELGAGRIINIKPGRVGGFAESLGIHRLSVDNGLPVWCGGMLESGVGRSYNVALASLPGFVLPGDLSPSARYWNEDIVDPEWTMSPDGFVDVPHDRPGLGIEVRRDRVDTLTVRKEVLSR